MVLKQIASELLKAAGEDQTVTRLVRLSGGLNSNVFRVQAQKTNFVLKIYPKRHEKDSSRLTAEKKFLDYTRNIGSSFTPRILSSSIEKNAALMDFIQGQKITAEGLEQSHVIAAMQFLEELNEPSNKLLANLPLAAEAQFSFYDHIRLVQERIDRLHEKHRGVRQIKFRLNAFMSKQIENIQQSCEKFGLDYYVSLKPDERCISPSDFGFHNAVVQCDNKVKFLDFEYAGWDDPAKTAADFIFQPQVPPPYECFDSIVDLLKRSPNNQQKLRAELLKPLFGLKWCCIMLNCFTSDWAKRAPKTGTELNVATYRKQQITKAEFALKHLIEFYSLSKEG